MGKYRLEDLNGDGRILLKRIFKKEDMRVLNGFICLMAGTSGGIL